MVIGEDGSGTVPKNQLPLSDITGNATVREPGRDSSDPIEITVPGSRTPASGNGGGDGDLTATPTEYQEKSSLIPPTGDTWLPVGMPLIAFLIASSLLGAYRLRRK